jgi:hypothetical protein
MGEIVPRCSNSFPGRAAQSDPRHPPESPRLPFQQADPEIGRTVRPTSVPTRALQGSTPRRRPALFPVASSARSAPAAVPCSHSDSNPTAYASLGTPVFTATAFLAAANALFACFRSLGVMWSPDKISDARNLGNAILRDGLVALFRGKAGIRRLGYHAASAAAATCCSRAMNVYGVLQLCAAAFGVRVACHRFDTSRAGHRAGGRQSVNHPRPLSNTSTHSVRSGRRIPNSISSGRAVACP